mmetsp:Transcript_13367/g.36871  ORF Transcript_13367/g.36871 Transcript_13367/m.36871 type:complete len:173 (-) Transcript_13367:6-524(-)
MPLHLHPKRSHELTLVRVAQYLKGTKDKGLILKPLEGNKLRMDCYVDSDFMGIYCKENRDDPDNVRSRAGHIICINDCPIIWNSKLMDAIGLSSAMTEYYALSAAMSEVLPLRELTKTLAEAVGLDPECFTEFKTTVWEDNMAALTLAKLDPGHTTPRSKFWFRKHLRNLPE